MNIINCLKNKFFDKKAFSLVENLLVLTILGIVVAITVPQIVSRRTIRNNQIAVRKAILSYQNFLKDRAVSSTGLMNTQDLVNAVRGTGNDCAPAREYFNVTVMDAANNCKFTTSDEIRWDLSDPDSAVIGIRGEAPTDVSAQDVNNDKVFLVPFQYDRDAGVQIMTSSNLALNAAIQKTNDFIKDNNN